MLDVFSDGWLLPTPDEIAARLAEAEAAARESSREAEDE